MAGLDLGRTILTVLGASLMAVAQVSLVVICGYVLARMGYLDKTLQRNLNILNNNLFTPALIISKIAPTLTPSKFVNIILVPLAFVVFTAISTLAGAVVALVLRCPPGSERIVMACAMTVNATALPIALVQSLVASVPALKIDEDDTPDEMLARAISYLVLYSTLGLVWRSSFVVSFMANASSKPEADVEKACKSPASEMPPRGETPPPPYRLPLMRRIWHGFVELMSPALVAALIAVFIAVIPPVQHQYVKLKPVTAALDSLADIAIPLTLVVLGSYFYEPKPIKDDLDPPVDMIGATRVVWASIISRMIISPIVLLPFIFCLALGTLVKIFDDPVFLLSMVLLACGPTALMIAQLTTSASPAFEKIISRVLFISYIVFVLPTTILGTLLSIIVSLTPDKSHAMKAIADAAAAAAAAGS